jgi:predicted P-loop ATPase
MALDFGALAARLLSQSRSLLPEWFPAGRWRGHEFVVGNLRGDPGESLSVNADTGRWCDFANGEAGGDLISLYAAANNLSQLDAFKELDSGTIGDRIPAPPPPAEGERKKDKWTPILPVPPHAGVPPDTWFRKPKGAARWIKHEAVARWTYLDRDGKVLGYTCRFEWEETDEETGEVVRKKDVVPQVFAANQDGQHKWVWRSFQVQRPLYGLPALFERPSAPVMIVEGEKKVDALRQLAPQYVGIAWPGGCKAWKKVDLSPLKGRTVTLMPDADNPGITAMWEIGHALLRLCPTVKIIIPEGVPEGWDVADAVAEGWTWERFKTWAVPKVKLVTEGNGNGPETGGAGPEHRGGDGAGGKAAAARPPETRDPGVDRGDRAQRDGVGDPHDVGSHDADRRVAGGPASVSDGADRGAVGDQRPQGGGLPAQSIEAGASQVARWLSWGLDRNGNGAPLANLNNAVTILERDPALQGLVWFDEFLQRLLTGTPAREWTEADDINLCLYMQRGLGISKIGREIIRQAVVAIAYRHPRNCVRDWLDGLKRDGTQRLEDFFPDYFGTENTEYTRAAGRNFWLSIIARVYRPGCKVDNMIVLEGSQGAGKSTAVQVIAGEWFAEQHESATNARAFAEILQGKLIVEISEMDAFSRAEVNRVKQVVTCPSDRFRPSGAHGYAKDHPRQCVFVGTTNRDDWNKDETGARRFWPIRCGEINVEGIREVRDLLFAEAVARFKAGEPWHVMPVEETRREQRKRYDADPWIEPVSSYLIGRDEVTVNDILTDGLRFEFLKIGRHEQMRVATCLRVLGWSNTGNTRRGGKVIKVWTHLDQQGSDLEDAT